MEKELEFNYTTKYYTLGEVNSETKQVWWVLHGYGQLGKFFIQKFKSLAEKKVCIIAPEGLSNYYLSGNAGRVGASWMTRENRFLDIHNYLAYLDAINEIEKAPSSISTTVFGFSQGAATAARWILNGNIEFERLILWAGLFPTDMDFEKGNYLLKEKEIVQVMGRQDPFITKEKIDEMEKLNQKLKLNPKIIEFDGGHEIDQQVLLTLAFN